MTDEIHKSTLKNSPLDNLHKELGAKRVPFGGYDMPVQYSEGILQEHKHTRSNAGLFDISHMGQFKISGKGATTELETLIPSTLQDLAPFKQRYTVFTLPNGGILDDLMVTYADDHFFLVVNAARKEVDLAHLRDRFTDKCQITELSGQALLALQGPKAMAVMARLAPGLDAMPFMSGRRVSMDRIKCFVSRSGYTGEDGYEISLPGDAAEGLARRLLEQPEVAPVGLGARDSLRLEAGLCLYGHDIDETTTLAEAGLNWVVASAYRGRPAKIARFPGADVVLNQLSRGPSRIRVGLRPEGRAPVREGAQIFSEDNKPVGRVTSGGFAPTINGPIAMGYVRLKYARASTRLIVYLRNKQHYVRVTPLPFVKHRYFGT